MQLCGRLMNHTTAASLSVLPIYSSGSYSDPKIQNVLLFLLSINFPRQVLKLEFLPGNVVQDQISSSRGIFVDIL